MAGVKVVMMIFAAGVVMIWKVVMELLLKEVVEVVVLVMYSALEMLIRRILVKKKYRQNQGNQWD